MKKQLLILVMMLLPMVAMADVVEINGIYYNLVDKTAEVTSHPSKYTGAVNIPPSVTYEGVTYDVTSIRDYAFLGCYVLTSVTIPNSVTSIGGSAFYGCSGLTSMVVDSGNSVYDSRGGCNAIIKTSNNELVAGCKNTTIPNSVTAIGIDAFWGCSGLTSVTIPNSVTSIGGSAFYGCSGLTSVTIPNSVTSIGGSAFSECTGLTSVTIPNSVTSIGDGAFSGCSGLTAVTIPNSVTSIGDGAFDQCSGLTAVYITDIESWCKISFSSYYSNPLSYAHHLYMNGSEITQLEIPNSVTSIGDYAFYKCSGLTSVTIPNSVTSIGDGAFYECDELSSVTIGNSVTSIGDDAFSGCSGLTAVYITDIESWCKISFSCCGSNPLSYAHHLYMNGSEITQLVIPNSVTSIGEYTFYECSGLTSVIIGNSVTSIGGSAFHGCSGLTSVTIPNSVTSIGNNAFQFCSGLTSVTIPNSVTSIGAVAFYGCSGLTSVTIPNSVTSIGTYTFYGSGLTSVTIPNSVTSIGVSAFGWSGLTSVTIPNSVTSIGAVAFEGCHNLAFISIGSGIQSIGSYAFAYCQELADVYCYAENVPSTNSNAFQGSYSLFGSATLHVPDVSITKYAKTAPWSSFVSVVGLNGTTPYQSVTPQCAKPIISIKDGKLEYSCETEGVKFISDCTYKGGKTKVGNELILSDIITCHVTVYATKEGYLNSDDATADVELQVGKKGDTNADGKVTITDAVSVVNIILNNGEATAPTLQDEEEIKEPE